METDETTENGRTNRNTWFRIQSIEREPNHKQLDVIRRTLQSDVDVWCASAGISTGICASLTLFLPTCHRI